jgi:hypothetical protein
MAAMLIQLHVYPPVIPERFWPESRNAADWIPAKGMPE